MRACKRCNKEFEPKVHNQIYCCLECRTEAETEAKEERARPRFAIFQRDHFKCVYCGRSPIEDNVTLVIEHVYPRVSGGDSSLYNVVTACSDCNRAKGWRMIPMDVYKRIIRRNIKLNKGISSKVRQEIKLILDSAYPYRTVTNKYYKPEKP